MTALLSQERMVKAMWDYDFTANDYEDLILARQENEEDECSSCEFKNKCRQQCMEIVEGRSIFEVYPNLMKGAK